MESKGFVIGSSNSWYSTCNSTVGKGLFEIHEAVFTSQREPRLDGWRGRAVIVVAFERFVAVRGA